jgi:HD-like signal output (HDOD) protein
MDMLASTTAAKHPTMEKLWTQVKRRGDLPGFSRAVNAIVTAMRGENDRDFNITKTVLSDPALTQRVLRLANSPMYAVFGGGINTVSKAVVVLGSEVIGHLALGLKLIDGLSSAAAGAEGARGEMEKALLAGHVARELASSTTARDTEEAVVCSMLHSLGRMMSSFYLPDEWQIIQGKCGDGISERDAAREVLGLDLADIGRLVAARWGLPDSLIDTMQEVRPEHGDEPLNHAQWLAALSTVSARCADIMHKDEPQAGNEISRVAGDYADMLGLEKAQILAAVDNAQIVAAEEEVFVRPSVQAERRKAAVRAPGKPADAAELLRTGVADLRQTAGDMSVSQVMTMALETVYQGLGLTRAILFLRNADEGRYAARMHLGDSSPELIVRLVFGDAYEPDVFHAALANNKMVFVEHPHELSFSSKLPRWWKESLGTARSFVVLPFTIHRQTVGFIYGDWHASLPPVSIDPAEVAPLDELRMLMVDGIEHWRRLDANLRDAFS